MASQNTPCDAYLQTFWQAEGALVQCLMFSLLLVTLALTFQRLSHTDGIHMLQPWALTIAISLAIVAVGFAVVGTYAYGTRSLTVRGGCGKESLFRNSFVVLACFLLLLEIAFTVSETMSIFMRPKN